MPLPGAVAGRQRSVDLRRAVLVEPHGELRAVDLSHPDQRRQRDRLTRGVAHVELADVVRLGPELALGLDVHLPDATVLVEVVHEGAAEERLQRLVDRAERDPLLEDLVAIDLGEELRRARQQGGEEPRELGSLPRGGQELLGVLGEERGILARAILEHERHAAGRADARDGGRREGEGLRLGHAGQLLVQLADDHVGGEPVLVARVPVLQRDEVERRCRSS